MLIAEKKMIRPHRKTAVYRLLSIKVFRYIAYGVKDTKIKVKSLKLSVQ